jgi:murein DD-endopeptidase MepM/ murein hydrolase activator NlpD
MRRRTHRPGGMIIPALTACFCVGIMVGWWLRSGAPMPAVSNSVAATTGEPLVAPAAPAAARTSRPLPTSLAPLTSIPGGGAIGDLRARSLRVPIDDAKVEAMKGGFDERRDSGGRPHEAVDILAPRNTPIHAVEDGTIAKLFESKAGGLTIYQYDPSGHFCYYYAHLERYAAGLGDGQRVSRGDVIGFVGTSGNAPANTPHLHFAVFELEADRHWWKGRAIDPYLIFRP